MRLPRPISNLIEVLELLPGIGPKTAARLTFYLLSMPKEQSQRVGEAITALKESTKICGVCGNVGEEDPCLICADDTRDLSILCVVEDPLDVLAFEKTGKYRGLYHVLGGLISPLNHIGPEDLRIQQLLDRLSSSAKTSEDRQVREIILALNPTIEGEATAMYIRAAIGKQQTANGGGIKITRLARGIPVGADLEYADEVTLSRALEGRSEY